MRRILIHMRNRLFGDAIGKALRYEESDFDANTAENPDEILEVSRYTNPYAVLLEVTACTPCLFEDRIRLRKELKNQNPDVKIVFIVDENSDKTLAKNIRQAKKDGLIDQFIYGSVSASYMIAIIDCL